MPSPGSFTPDFALVAYAEVSGAAGTSTTMNSGVMTSRTALGTYTVTLQTAMQQADSLSQIYVQPRGTVPLMSAVEDTSDQVKTVRFSSSSTTAVNTDFSIFIWRSTIPVNTPQTAPS